MNELVRHIEILLLENDCVVVPGFGGFITHYVPAIWNDSEGVFLPPVRTIGFNPQLRMNDGVLVQSYMEVYNTDFPDATRILQKEVDKLIELLHREGKVDLFNVGEISLSVHGSYIFSSYNDKVTSPYFYGLDTFEIKDLIMLQQSSADKQVPLSTPITPKKTYVIRINRTLVRNAVAAIAAVLLFFYMSDPIENTYVERANYAQLLPSDLFEKIESQSLLTTPVVTGIETQTEQLVQDDNIADETLPEDQNKVIPVTVKEVKVSKVESTETVANKQAVQTSSKRHHIIIASVTSTNDAQSMVAELKSKGYDDACVLTEGDRVRVSLISHDTREDADNYLTELRKDNAYKNAWLLIK